MKLIIDIPDEFYEVIRNTDKYIGECGRVCQDSVFNGTPLKEWLDSFNTDSAPQCFNKIQDLKREVEKECI